MAKRSYRQNCSLAQAVDLLGERWTLLLVRDLLVAPRRFRDLERSLKGIGPNLLAARLKDLEAAGIVERCDGEGRARTYALTHSGVALEPAVLALVRWGLTHGPGNQPGFHHQDDWDLLALKALFRPHRAGPLELRVQYRAAEMTGWMKLTAGTATIGLGELDRADLVIDGTVADLFLSDEPPERLLSRGSASDLQHYMSAFALRA